MQQRTPLELKKVLQEKGFEIYRTTAEEVVLADRVRDNLLMDSAVSVRATEPVSIRVILHAQSSDFAGEAPDKLFGRVRRLGESALRRGFREAGTRVVPIADPGDRSRTLDTWYEVWFERPIDDSADLETELRAALAVEKAVRS
jgi:hypothetical protein